MKNAMLLLSVLLISVSCVEINGTLTVREAMNVRKKSGFLNTSSKIVKLDAGLYRATLKVKGDKNLNLQLKGGSVGEIDVGLKSNSSLNIPDNGQFYIEGAKISQPFNISGSIKTDYSTFGYARELVKCDITRIERQCDKVCVARDPKEANDSRDSRDARDAQKCEVICKDVSVTYQGLKDVDYHYSQTDRSATLEFMPENSTAVVATLPATGTETSKVIDRETICR